jgi:hypothetical protein
MTELSSTIRLRPTRIGFLVRPNDLSAVRNVMRCCACVWGGLYNPIIPVLPIRPFHLGPIPKSVFAAQGDRELELSRGRSSSSTAPDLLRWFECGATLYDRTIFHDPFAADSHRRGRSSSSTAPDREAQFPGPLNCACAGAFNPRAGSPADRVRPRGTDHSTALFACKCQSFLDNVIAGFRGLGADPRME